VNKSEPFKNLVKCAGVLLLAGWANSLAAFTYSDTDLLLVFRKDGGSNVLFNVGSISSYLGQPGGTRIAVSNWDFSLVQSSFGGDLTGVKYVLMAVDSTSKTWLSDSAATGLPNDQTHSQWTLQHSKINAVGSRATTYPEAVGQSLAISSADPNSYTQIASSGGTLDVTTISGTSPFPVEQGLGSSVRMFELNVSPSSPKPPATQVGRFYLSFDGNISFIACPDPVIVVTNRAYVGFRTDLAGGTYTYVDIDPTAGSPVRATQRCLGYREVDYKSIVPATLTFSNVPPSTNAGVITYDYSAFTAKTTTIGFWVDKDVPMLIGPDGLCYITDGHHTTAGLLASSPVRQLLPGKNRLILGHIVANFYDPNVGAQPVTDAWWTARQAENNALLYGPDGDQLTLPGEPNYANLQPILPSVLAMPTTPSTLTTNGVTAMTPSTYRGLTWALADGIIQSASDSTGKKIVGYKKSAPGSSVDINFVEFFWADYMRHRIVWDDTLTGSPLNSPNGDASATAAPLSFFTAVANGIALAKSQAYLDEYGRNITNYTNSAVFQPNTLNWANGSISNGLAVATDTYNLYLRDDSTIAGTISPSPLSTNTLHIDTVSGMTPTQTLQNIRTVIVNAGGTLKTTWKDTPVSNTTLRLPAGSGVVTVAGNNFVAANTILGGGTLDVEGTLAGNLQVTNGVLNGHGIVNGAVVVSASGTLSPGASIGTITINGPLTLSGATVMEINKSGAVLTSDLVNGITTLTYGGTLTLVASGDALASGDSFKLFDAASYSGAFATLTLPALGAGLAWDSSRLIVDGTISVSTTAATSLTLAATPLTQTVTIGSTVTLQGGAVGTEPIAYRWQFNLGDIAGQTNSTLTLPNIQESSQGQYRFIAQNSAGSVTSAVAIVTVNQPPVSQAQSLTMYWNTSLNITLFANDPDLDPLTFTLTQPAHGTLTGTGTNLTYTPTSGYSGPDSFTYKLSDGLLSSATATISITVKLDFSYQDTDLLLVFRRSGDKDVIFDLGSVSNYLGRANGAVLGITNYDFGRVQSNFGSDLTGVKYVLVAATTPTDSLLRAWLSDGASSGVPSDETQSRWGQQRSKINAVGTHAMAYSYPDATNQSLAILDSSPDSYTFIASGGPGLDVSTMGGASPFPVEQDLGGDIRLFELRVSTANPKPFAHQVGRLTLATNGTVTFTAGLILPAIVAEPSNQTIECGSSAIFSVTASGDEPLSYQWQLNGTNIAGATSSTLNASAAGSYTVVVNNSGGATTNNHPALLSLTDTTPPVLSVPANIIVSATSSAGATGVFAATANDVCVGSVVPVCTPASGSTFPLGTTTVNCTANDGSGNIGSASFSFTVKAGFTYADPDLLLVLRRSGDKDVLYNLGSVSNYLNKPLGTVLNVTNFDFSRALSNFGGNLAGVKYVLIAATSTTDPLLRAWLSDSSPVGLPTDETQSRWGQQRSKINAVGSLATSYFYPDATNQSLTISDSNPNSYSSIASGGGTLDVTTMSGASPFPVEQDLGSYVRLFELKVSGVNPKPVATQVGQFAMGTDGSLVFTADRAPLAAIDGAATLKNAALNISAADLTANDSDADLDPLTVVSVSGTSTNGGTVALSGGVITYMPVAGYSGLDSFTYTVSDGRGGTISGQVIVFVSNKPLPGPNALIIAGIANVCFAGTPGQIYDIQRAPTPAGTWTTVLTTVAPVYGIIQYTDPSPLPGKGFYRALSH